MRYSTSLSLSPLQQYYVHCIYKESILSADMIVLFSSLFSSYTLLSTAAAAVSRCASDVHNGDRICACFSYVCTVLVLAASDYSSGSFPIIATTTHKFLTFSQPQQSTLFASRRCCGSTAAAAVVFFLFLFLSEWTQIPVHCTQQYDTDVTKWEVTL